MLKKIFTINYPILINSIPKSGTNLIANIVAAAPNTRRVKTIRNNFLINNQKEQSEYVISELSNAQPGDIFILHNQYNKYLADWLVKSTFKHIFVYRNPRDYTISLYNYLKKLDIHNFSFLLEVDSKDQSLLNIIKGMGRGQKELFFSKEEKSYPNVGLLYKSFGGWLNESEVYSVSYESLIGDHTIKVIEERIYNLMRFLGYSRFIKIIIGKIRKKGMDTKISNTFHTGTNSRWKDYYNYSHLEAFKKVFTCSSIYNFKYE